MLRKIWRAIYLRGSELPFYSRYTYHFQLRAALLEGLGGGIMSLESFVLRKTLGGSPEMLALLMSLGLGSFILSPFCWSYLRRCSPRKVLIVLGVLGHCSLVLIAFTSSPLIFVFAVSIPALVSPVFLPLRNTIVERNHSAHVRGKTYAYISAYTVLVVVIMSQTTGFALDWKPGLYRLLFPVAGVAGSLFLLYYAKIKIRRLQAPVVLSVNEKRDSVLRTFRKSVRDVFRVLKENPAFRKFERNFFIYGIGFLMSQPVVVVFVVNHLKATYASAAGAILVMPIITQMISLPVWGRMLDRFGAPKTAGFTIFLFALWALLLFCAALESNLLLFFVAYAVFGMALGGLDVVWNIGPIEFCGRRSLSEKPVAGEAGSFTAIHSMFVGIRALFAPWLGVAALWLFGVQAAFLIACGFFSAACILMFRLHSSVKKMRSAESNQ
ncbi:MAG: MFS transporter [Planctomycetota bacterium]